MDSTYHTLSPPPDDITAGNVIGRLLAGIGFRFTWATDGLTEETYAFRPVKDSRSIGETVGHIWDTLNWVYRSFDRTKREKPGDPRRLREGSLEYVVQLEELFSGSSDERLRELRILDEPFWLMVNGPLADILTHIGQIASLRRMAGSPAPASNPFRGRPPKEH